MTAERIVVLGGGGHAQVVIDALAGVGVDVWGIVTHESCDRSTPNWLGTDEWLLQQAPDSCRLVNGVGSVKHTEARQAVFERFAGAGFAFASVVHRSAIVATDVQLGQGCVIMAGAIVQTGARIGENVLVNTGAQVDHDCIVESHAHIAVGAVCCGSVRVSKGAHIGAGAILLQGVTVGPRSVVGAGAVVLRDVPGDAVVVGNPGRELNR